MSKYRPKKRRASDRPKKPYPDFPLSPHASGMWQKKIRGRVHYFGRWGVRKNGKLERLPGDGWEHALALYKAQADDLHAGRTPRTLPDGAELSLADLCNQFLTAKLRKVESDELSPRTLTEYRQTTDRLIDHFGKARLVDDLVASDFEKLRSEIARTCGPVRLGNEITRVKSVFKYASDNRLVEKPVNFGTEFRKPGKGVMRKHRASCDRKLFEPKEVRLLAQAASPVMKAAILLGVNAGLGNTDISNLKYRHLDLDGGWLNYARGKTGIQRRIPLWPETIESLREAISKRPQPKSIEDAEVVLLTSRGERLVRLTAKSRSDGITSGFGKLLRDLGIRARKGLGFYSLRHTFATVGLQAGDRDVVKSLMGHAENDMLSAYDETGPNNDRLRAVVEHVRCWLFEEA